MASTSPKRIRSRSLDPESAVPKTRKIPDKCLRCAMLSAEKAKALHGPEGDGCWNPKVCYNRRSHARHRDRRNQARNRQRQTAVLEELAIDISEFAEVWTAILVVYRRAGADTPVHAIAAQIWQGQQQVAVVQPIHCMGLVPSQVHAYLRRLLSLLDERYGIRKFASQERFDPELCPIRPCIHHPMSER